MAHLPPDRGAEVAFAGRSNAGKSSALNALCAQKSLARTSKTPGRTQQLVYFALDEDRRLLDLPGYGYAKVPTAIQANWQQTLDRFFRERQCLNGLVLLMDIRHPLKEYDEQMLNWCNHQGLPVLVLLTKADKLTRGPAQATLLKVRQACRTYPQCQVQLFSATKGQGLDEARAVIAQWLHHLTD
jgi:GTP-binding protein